MMIDRSKIMLPLFTKCMFLVSPLCANGKEPVLKAKRYGLVLNAYKKL